MTKALLVIDMLKDFLEKDGALCIGDTKQLIQNVGQRLLEWRVQGDPVIYIVDRHLPQDAEFAMFPPHCLAGERGGEVIDELTPRPGDYIVYKRRYSAFFGTDLDLILRELGIGDLEIAGVCTQICVLYTAADARMLSYTVTVKKNCVDSFDHEAHLFALNEMDKTLGVKLI